MQHGLNQANNITNVKERIKDLERRHCDDLETLYHFQATGYLEEAMDKRLSKDDLQYLADGENNASYAKLNSVYTEARKSGAYTHEWDDQLYQLRTAYMRRLLPLQQLLDTLETQDAEARRRRDAGFPRSVQDYRSIRNKEVQLRVARFLATDDVQKQETMMGEFGWAWRQVQPLKDEYERDAEFKGEIESLAVRDPRRKR